jgi:hypothetical protein
VLGAVGMGLHHKLCHTLGGSFGLPHAETHAVVIAHAVAYNEAVASAALERAARALGVRDSSQAAGASTSAVHPALRRRSPQSACRRTSSTPPPTSPRAIRIRTRDRSTARRFARCCKAHSTEPGRSRTASPGEEL